VSRSVWKPSFLITPRADVYDQTYRHASVRCALLCETRCKPFESIPRATQHVKRADFSIDEKPTAVQVPGDGEECQGSACRIQEGLVPERKSAAMSLLAGRQSHICGEQALGQGPRFYSRLHFRSGPG
jgi:hypothetical protein